MRDCVLQSLLYEVMVGSFAEYQTLSPVEPWLHWYARDNTPTHRYSTVICQLKPVCQLSQHKT